jgi:hypothetical protein
VVVLGVVQQQQRLQRKLLVVLVVVLGRIQNLSLLISLV